jgi:hypothetical protein
MEYRAARWNGEGSPKSASKGKERVRASSSQDRGRESRPNPGNRQGDCQRLLMGVSGGGIEVCSVPSKILAPELKE